MAVKNNSILDINKYVKHNYEDIKEYVDLLKDPDNITNELLTEMFSNTIAEQNDDGEITVGEPKFRATDYFDLPAGVLKNQKQAVKDTTFGIFIFNSLVINNAFDGLVNYKNDTLDKDELEKMHSKVAELVLTGKLTVEQYGTFINTTLWLGYQTELFMPGVSLNLIVPKKSVKDLKAKLLKEHPEFLDPKKEFGSDGVAAYVDLIEKPLLEEAQKEIKKDPSSRLYDLKKPKFSNNYKNGIIENGPMLDTRTNTFRINNNSFNDGITGDTFDILANKAMYASFSRAVNTQKGGTFAKYTNNMMQSIILDKKGTNCGTTGYLLYHVTKANVESIKYRYYVGDNGELKYIDNPDIPKLIGKRIKLRSSLFCKDKHGICNICAGNLFYMIGIENVGLTCNVPMNKSLNASLKRFHDLSIKTVSVNPEDFMQFDK